MACMKCGKNTEDGQMFCAHCLEGMEKYPVRPDAHIQLPARNAEAAPKKQIRKSASVRKDGQVRSLRAQIRWMWVVIIALALALAVLLGRGTLEPNDRKPGQDYTYSETTP